MLVKLFDMNFVFENQIDYQLVVYGSEEKHTGE